MRKIAAGFTVLVFAFLAVSQVLAQSTTSMVMAGKEHWTAGTGMLKGVQVATLFGDPSKSGPYIIRIKLPANHLFPPHFHDDWENVTVISGTMMFGLGDTVNRAKMQTFGPGSFASIAPKVHHYGISKTDAVIEISAVGPRTMTAVKSRM